ncbi:septal ring lytic transglycosylase RlpA family protein [Conexibacter sp. JD483]|uniref:septal ring lytic transglycosylase RlpA family protein n=1 Tax=unclassified Conexibacter TaxID=2627773 RepID=UPI00271A13AF|nr:MULTISPECIES: septal ring lytic transglycosylase RlpA family protein [unclassified Conexibacter]MDO8185322.1 septal ring lytic transglycosylase RlpA family protein [Conexibacter sp. CPCC 205706]MDO8198502.1 septal ring lytic transglycosylase RlpA family protein [Conexibacter sp. CPCC 205762]MDR9368733.1 septal ring lytic transglycosylase RlpA family protein [Conexibacter sp. JD483]
MYRSLVLRRRIVAALVLSALAGIGFAAGLSAARGERAGAAAEFVQSPLPADAADGDGWQRAVASRFDDYGDALACGGVLEQGQLGVASRTLPCGTPVTFAYRGRSVTVPVIDRGPYVDGREWDLTGATADALRFPGLATVAWRR